MMPVVDIVPGDILFLKGGQIVPADCTWVEGDVIQVSDFAILLPPHRNKSR
jgi:H+-transporting ATPase